MAQFDFTGDEKANRVPKIRGWYHFGQEKMSCCSSCEEIKGIKWGVFDTAPEPPTGPDDDPLTLAQPFKNCSSTLGHLYILLQNATLALMSIS